MIPATVGGILALILVVAPGIWYELVRQRSRPGRTDSTFVESTRILLAGMLISFGSLAILLAVGQVNHAAVVDLTAITTQPTYIQQNIPLAAWSLLWFLTISMTIGPLWLYLLPGARLHGPVYPESLWVTFFRRVPDHQRKQHGKTLDYVYLQVHTRDAVYRGRLAGYDNSAEGEDRELALGEPLWRADKEGTQWVKQSDDWAIAIIKAADITDIEVAYIEKTTTNHRHGILPAIIASLSRRTSTKRVKDATRPPGLGRPILILFICELVILVGISAATRSP